MAMQISSAQANNFEVKNPTLLQQALNHHELRGHDGTLANISAESDTNVRKSRKMRDTADNFKKPQIEITQDMVTRHLMQKLGTMSQSQSQQYLDKLSDLMDWDKRKGGNVFVELALIQEASMKGNQSATIGRLSQEQADQTQMTIQNTQISDLANNMQSNAAQAYADQQKAKSAQNSGFLGDLFMAIGIVAILATVVVAAVTCGAAAPAVAAEVGAEAGAGAAAGAADAAGTGATVTADATADAAGTGAEAGADATADAGGDVAEETGAEAAGDTTADTGTEGSSASSENATNAAQESKTTWMKTIADASSKFGRAATNGFKTMFSGWRLAISVPLAGCAIGGFVASQAYGHVASAATSDIQQINSKISANATEAQVFTNNLDMMNQDITQQNTNVSQLNDANTAAASFISSAARDMQQVQSLGNMF